MKTDQSESGMNALLQNAAKRIVAFDQNDIRSVLFRSYRRRQSGRPAADDGYIMIHDIHTLPPPASAAVLSGNHIGTGVVFHHFGWIAAKLS